MFVHVVKRGENIHQIARAALVDAEHLAILNGLVSERPVPGSSLLVPTKVPTSLLTYTVKEGDTLRKIASRFHIPEKIALSANPALSSTGLTFGSMLTLPVPLQEKHAIELNLRLEVQGDPDEWLTVEEAAPALSGISIATAWLEESGALVLPDHFDRRLQAMIQKRVPERTLLLIAPMDEQAAARVLGNGEVRRTFFRELRPLIAADEFAGVHLEFTALPPDLRVAFNGFVRELAVRVHHHRGVLYLGVQPHLSDDPDHPRHGAYDLSWLARYADRIVWNAEEGYGRADGPPTALAPLHLVHRSLLYATKVVPRSKLLLGLPFYGFDWPHPYDPERTASVFLHGPHAMEEEWEERPKQVLWDDRAMSPMFTYRDDTGELREVWYEDARSIAAKLHLVQMLGLRGISCQVMGSAWPAAWPLLQDRFEIRRFRSEGQV